MSPKKVIPLRAWAKERGIPYRRLEPFTVHGGGSVDAVTGDILGTPVAHADWPGWVFELDLAGSGGVWAFSARLTDEARDKGVAIGARDLRLIPLTDMALAVRAHHALEDEGRGWSPPKVRKREAGPAPVSNHTLAAAMVAYITAAANGGATEEAADEFGVAPATMTNYRNEAKRRGLFKSHGRGKPGGVLTPAGQRALKEVER